MKKSWSFLSRFSHIFDLRHKFFQMKHSEVKKKDRSIIWETQRTEFLFWLIYSDVQMDSRREERYGNWGFSSIRALWQNSLILRSADESTDEETTDRLPNGSTQTWSLRHPVRCVFEQFLTLTTHFLLSPSLSRSRFSTEHSFLILMLYNLKEKQYIFPAEIVKCKFAN